ncbi:uncharacterized protein LAESUDRAFT_746436 [Laetiporus sulphureus 93-53]|uniref:Uncharacterized protein n=1 Tax=Laetiporus sulphureus 93-53 TaxID=1314785 RepID=A0A165IH03_9APHY|nr:uncharacterized protein LAESUDRAFT_746436 [Laetiporus sulphureus 93-53]KZT13059.1 hypothetical protein LAESUDRAFT_746436 [Laetiporus sulphureus 93-53]
MPQSHRAKLIEKIQQTATDGPSCKIDNSSPVRGDSNFTIPTAFNTARPGHGLSIASSEGGWASTNAAAPTSELLEMHGATTCRLGGASMQYLHPSFAQCWGRWRSHCVANLKVAGVIMAMAWFHHPAMLGISARRYDAGFYDSVDRGRSLKEGTGYGDGGRIRLKCVGTFAR